jgi:hypothetical protein
VKRGTEIGRADSERQSTKYEKTQQRSAQNVGPPEG